MKGTVFERFEAVAQVRGASLALEADGFRLSYKELLTEAGRLRAKLWHLGASRPGIVAILTEHRTTAVVSMLGTAGSGHAYVPIDPADPDARISGLLKQVKPIAMIADRPLRERAEALALPGCVVIDPSDREGVAEPAPLHALRADPDSLLYISFTSGSTGVPKGVCQTHRNLIFHASAYIDLLGIDKEDRMSWLFAHGASASNMDIYGALFSGACLCAHDIRDDSFANLARWLDQSAVTLLHTVPTVIRELAVAMSGHARLRHVRAVDLAGEMLLGEDVARLRGCVPAGCQIYNRLAATECSFISSFKVCDTAHRTALPVGKPPAGVEIRILLDDGDKEAPLGETGRIAVDSRYVCPGYLGQSELGSLVTELADRPGWRRYRSADVGFVDPQGNLQMVGRTGSRIKLRGHAIDLGEVEAALLTCPGISGAAVVPRSMDGGEAQEIVACLTLHAGVGADPLAIRKRLSKMIPAHMVPGGFVFLDELPRTATSKVDRRALQALDLGKVRFRPGYMPPADELEERVARLFAEVLQIHPVGRTDDFFLLGGDSLSLNTLQVLALEVLGRQIPRLAEEATVKSVADRLREPSAQETASPQVLLQIRHAGDSPPLFMVHGRLGQAHVGPHFLEALGQGQPVYALQAKGLDGRLSPHESIEAMAHEYLAAIRRQCPHGPWIFGGLCAGSYVTLEMARAIEKLDGPVLAVLLIDPPILPALAGKRPYEPFPSDANLLYRIRRRVSQGTVHLDMRNEGAVEASIRVARAFEGALRSHHWKGPVAKTPLMIIASKNRWRDEQTVRRFFGSRTDALMLEGDHDGILAPGNEAFISHIRHCLQRVAELAGRPGQDGEVGWGNQGRRKAEP